MNKKPKENTSFLGPPCRLPQGGGCLKKKIIYYNHAGNNYAGQADQRPPTVPPTSFPPHSFITSFFISDLALTKYKNSANYS